MREKHVYQGNWHLPNFEEIVGGTLTFEPDEGAYLELFGGFSCWDPFDLPSGIEIVLGTVVSGKAITLLDCFCTSRRNSGYGITSIEYLKFSVRFVLIDAHIESLETLKFSKILANIHNLREWVGVSGVNVTYSDLSDGREVEASYRQPVNVEFEIDQSTRGKLVFDRHTSERHRVAFTFSLEQTIKLEITSTESVPLEQLLKKVTVFQNFLTLALYHPTFIVDVTLESDSVVRSYEGFGDIPTSIILLASQQYKVDFFGPKKNDYEVFFTYDNIAQRFPEMIRVWYQKYEQLDHIMYLLFQQFYLRLHFTENSFLNLAQAIESYHERSRPLTKMPKSDYKKMRTDLLATSAPQYHEWLQGMFNFGNSPTLHQRLEDIISQFVGTDLDWIALDREIFIQQIKWSRNYYTHLGKELESKALKTYDLYKASLKLKLILSVCFLMEMGIGIETIAGWLTGKTNRFL